MVGLVQHDQAGLRDPVEEPGQLGLAHHGAGRVVGVADEDQPGPAGDRVRHRVQVVRRAGQRHLHRGGAGQAGQDRVGLERPPRVHDLGARLGRRHEQLLGHPDRAAAHRDLPGWTPNRRAIASVSATAPLSG